MYPSSLRTLLPATMLVALTALAAHVIAQAGPRAEAGPGAPAHLGARATEPHMPHIARYLGDRKGALSLTFDDGFRKEVEDATSILDPLGLKGTFFLMPLAMEDPAMRNNLLTWERARKLLADGHEIGTHGQTREKLHEATPERLDHLVNESFRILKQRLGVTPVSYALPGGSEPTAAVAAVIHKNHLFIRKSEWLAIRVLGYGSVGARKWTDEAARRTLTQVCDKGEWAVAVIHSIVGGYAPFASKDEFRGHCTWLKEQDATLWTAPMGVVGRYVRLRDASKLEVIEQSSGRLRAKLTNTVKPDELKATALTLVVPTPQAKSATATQAGKPLKPALQDGRILVDVLADGQEIVVQWQ